MNSLFWEIDFCFFPDANLQDRFYEASTDSINIKRNIDNKKSRKTASTHSASFLNLNHNRRKQTGSNSSK